VRRPRDRPRLLDAGADPNDAADDTRIGVIGWATSLWQLGEVPKDVVSLLLARGGRHHIFSAIAAGDVEVIRAFVEQQPEALDQRLPARYHGQTRCTLPSRGTGPTFWPAHRHGRRPGRADRNGQTALEYALLRGDARRRRVCAKRAREYRSPSRPGRAAATPEFADSIQKATVVVGSKDVAATLAWYASIGFTEVARFRPMAARLLGMVQLGKAELTFDVREAADPRGVSLLVETDRCGSSTSS
jgi:hypothetical protein